MQYHFIPETYNDGQLLFVPDTPSEKSQPGMFTVRLFINEKILRSVTGLAPIQRFFSDPLSQDPLRFTDQDSSVAQETPLPWLVNINFE